MNETIKQQYFSGVRWNIFGSVFYESIKLLHQMLLLRYMHFEGYGILGGLFSFIFLFINLASLGSEQTLSIFTVNFLESKKSFIKLLIPYLTINIISLLVFALIFNFFIPLKIHEPLVVEYAIPQLLIVVEGLRIFFRALLHAFNIHKYPVIAESLITLLYFSITWNLYFLFNIKISPFFVLSLYLFGSIIATALFIIRTIKLYQTLSNKIEHENYLGIFIRIFRARSYNYLLSLSRIFFTGNFVVAILVSRFSLTDAGIFKFSSYIADYVKGIAHSIINFSGGAFLGLLKNSSIENKKLGFNIINKSLNNIIFFITFLLMTNLHIFIKFKGEISFSIFVAGFFLLLALLEQYTLVYAQFFTLEEHLLPLAIQKFSELVLIFYILHLCENTSAIIVLFSLLVVKFFSFATLATEGYHRWKLVPTFLPSFRFLIFCVIIRLLESYIVPIFYNVPQ